MKEWVFHVCPHGHLVNTSSKFCPGCTLQVPVKPVVVEALSFIEAQDKLYKGMEIKDEL